MKFRLALAGLGTSMLTVLSACGNGPPPTDTTGSTGGGGDVTLVDNGPGVATVKETDANAFEPNSVSVKVGDVVEWTNSGQTGHNVTFDAGAATPSTMGQGDTAFFKFAKAGTYKYQCTIHAGMSGQVTVG